jgi:hypothetical protein
LAFADLSDAGPAPCSVLDIEASGFGARSYPIEVGWALPDGRTGCLLVCPPPHWTHWDAEAERVHGITRATLLRHGHAPLAVARRLNEELAGQTVYCDGWGHDYPWLATLYEEAELSPSFRLEPAARLLRDTQLGQLDALHRRAFDELEVQRHRASNDARALQRALQLLGAPRRV